MAMLSSWQADPLFPAAEEVQDSADRLRSSFHQWQQLTTVDTAGSGGGGLARVDEEGARLVLLSACDTLKWQLQEFERAVLRDAASSTASLRRPERASGGRPQEVQARRQQFISAIRAQLAQVDTAVRRSSSPRKDTRPTGPAYFPGNGVPAADSSQPSMLLSSLSSNFFGSVSRAVSTSTRYNSSNNNSSSYVGRSGTSSSSNSNSRDQITSDHLVSFLSAPSAPPPSVISPQELQLRPLAIRKPDVPTPNSWRGAGDCKGREFMGGLLPTAAPDQGASKAGHGGSVWASDGDTISREWRTRSEAGEGKGQWRQQQQAQGQEQEQNCAWREAAVGAHSVSGTRAGGSESRGGSRPLVTATGGLSAASAVVVAVPSHLLQWLNAGTNTPPSAASVAGRWMQGSRVGGEGQEEEEEEDGGVACVGKRCVDYLSESEGERDDVGAAAERERVSLQLRADHQAVAAVRVCVARDATAGTGVGRRKGGGSFSSLPAAALAVAAAGSASAAGATAAADYPTLTHPPLMQPPALNVTPLSDRILNPLACDAPLQPHPQHQQLLSPTAHHPLLPPPVALPRPPPRGAVQWVAFLLQQFQQGVERGREQSQEQGRGEKHACCQACGRHHCGSAVGVGGSSGKCAESDSDGGGVAGAGEGRVGGGGAGGGAVLAAGPELKLGSLSCLTVADLEMGLAHFNACNTTNNSNSSSRFRRFHSFWPVASSPAPPPMTEEDDEEAHRRVVGWQLSVKRRRPLLGGSSSASCSSGVTGSSAGGGAGGGTCSSNGNPGGSLGSGAGDVGLTALQVVAVVVCTSVVVCVLLLLLLKLHSSYEGASSIGTGTGMSSE